MGLRAKACPKCGAIAFKKIGGTYKCIAGHTFGNKMHAKRETGEGALSAFKSLVDRFGPVDSHLEGRYFTEHLGWLEKIGEASDIGHHTVIALLPKFNYCTDWDYTDKNGVHRYVDTKGGGTMGGRFPAIMAMWPIFGHGPLDIAKRSDSGRWNTKTILVGKWDMKQTPTGAWDFRKVA